MVPAVRALIQKLGDDAMSDLHILLDDTGRQWKDDVLMLAGERFERRLATEVGALRVDMAKEFAAVRLDMANEFAAMRVDMAKEFGAVRVEMAKELGAVRIEMNALATGTRTDLLKWSFLFWIGQVAAISGMLALLR